MSYAAVAGSARSGRPLHVVRERIFEALGTLIALEGVYSPQIETNMMVCCVAEAMVHCRVASRAKPLSGSVRADSLSRLAEEPAYTDGRFRYRERSPPSRVASPPILSGSVTDTSVGCICFLVTIETDIRCFPSVYALS